MLKASPINNLGRVLARDVYSRQPGSTQSLPLPRTNPAVEATQLKSNFTERFPSFLFSRCRLVRMMTSSMSSRSENQRVVEMCSQEAV